MSIKEEIGQIKERLSMLENEIRAIKSNLTGLEGQLDNYWLYKEDKGSEGDRLV